LIVWSFLFLLSFVFPFKHCTEVRLTEGAVFVSAVCKISFTLGLSRAEMLFDADFFVVNIMAMLSSSSDNGGKCNGVREGESQ
jgi:hypothetical protein